MGIKPDDANAVETDPAHELEMQRIRAQRRRMERIDVTDAVRQSIVSRLNKLEERFATLARSSATRADELRQIEQGLAILRETRQDR